jgi:dienelactone hydrolase
MLALLPVACTAGEGSHPDEPLAMVEMLPVPASGEARLYSVRLGRAGDDREVLAYLRLPADPTVDSLPGLVLVAGRQGGRNAARVLPDDLPFAVLAVEYPDDMPEEVGPIEAVREVGRIRRTARTMPGTLVEAGQFLAGMDGVDGERIAVMGVSFGVPFAAAAGSDPVFSAVILAFGGAGLRDLAAANLPHGNPLIRGVLASILATRLREFEPARHVPHISPTPLLLVNGVHDELIPRRTAVRLAEAARPPAEHVWLEEGHVGMADRALIARVGEVTASFLGQVWSDRGMGAGILSASPDD